MLVLLGCSVSLTRTWDGKICITWVSSVGVIATLSQIAVDNPHSRIVAIQSSEPAVHPRIVQTGTGCSTSISSRQMRFWDSNWVEVMFLFSSRPILPAPDMARAKRGATFVGREYEWQHIGCLCIHKCQTSGNGLHTGAIQLSLVDCAKFKYYAQGSVLGSTNRILHLGTMGSNSTGWKGRAK